MTSLFSKSGESLALETLDAIRSRLEQASVEQNGCTWCAGTAGVAVFFSEHAHFGATSPRGRGLAKKYLEESLQALADVSLPFGLFGGIAGIAWTAGYVASSAAESDFAEVDDALLALVSTRPYSGSFDLLEGLAGIALYAMERANDAISRRIIEQVVLRLKETWATGGGWPKRLVWMGESARAAHEEGELDVCVAHGVGGVLPVLALAAALEPAATEAHGLYLAARDWILCQQLDDPVSTFPTVIVPGRPATRSRAAWCYGDPGMAAALHAAARAMRDDDLMDFAVRTAERALRRPASSWGLSDLAICHGAAGVARCYHRLYQGSGREIFANAALAWLHVVLDSDRRSSWEEIGVLNGAAGVGLTLMDALSGACRGWDRPLGLSTAADETTPVKNGQEERGIA